MGFSQATANEIITEHLWPTLKGIIDTLIKNNQNIVIEGCYTFPDKLKEFPNEYRKEVIPVFMGFSKHYLENNFVSGVLNHKSIIESREDSENRAIDWFIEAH